MRSPKRSDAATFPMRKTKNIWIACSLIQIGGIFLIPKNGWDNGVLVTPLNIYELYEKIERWFLKNTEGIVD